MKTSSIEQAFSLRQNFSWSLVGNVFYSACQLSMLIVLARLGTPEMVGIFTFALAVTAPLFMFSNLQLRVVQATDAQAKFTFNDYLGLRLASSLLTLISLLLMTLMFPSGHSAVVLVIGIAKAIESVSDVCYGVMQQQERMDFISISLIAKGTLSLILLITGILATKQVMGGVVGLVMAWTTVLLGYDLRVTKRLVKVVRKSEVQGLMPSWKWPIQQKLIRLALPLGFVMLVISINSNIPQYLIQYFIVRDRLKPEDLGIFAAIAYFMLVGSVLQGALAQTASPRLAKYYADGRRRAFAGLLFNLMGLGVLMGGIGAVISWAFGKQLLNLIYGAQYAQYSHLLVWLMLAAGLEYICSFLGMGITSAQYFRVQVPLFATSAAMMAIASFILIPIYGLTGIPIAIIATGVFRIVLCVAVLAHALKKHPSPDIHPPVFL